MSAAEKLWEPSQSAIESALVTQFARYCVHRFGLKFNTYPEFYRWTCDESESFWSALWDWAEVRGRKGEESGTGGRNPVVRIVAVRGFKATSSLAINLVKDFFYSARVAMRVERADVMVTNSFWMPVMLSFRRVAPEKIVVHVARYPKGQFRLYRRAHALQAISTAIASEIVRQVPEVSGKVHVLPYPVDLGVYSPPATARNREGVQEILYVGRIHPEKGLELLLRAFRIVASKVPQVRLKIVGPSSEEAGGGGQAWLDSLIAMAAGLPAVFVGPISDPTTLASELQRAHCFCYPSVAEKGEAFGLAVLEAMATGLPVIVSDLACFADFMASGREGLVFDHRAPAPEIGLADCLVRVLRDSRYASQLGEHAAAKAAEYAQEAVAARYLALFEKLSSD